MKRRFIAFLLVFFVSLSMISDVKRASAAPAAAGVVLSIGILAWQLMQVITGTDFVDDFSDWVDYCHENSAAANGHTFKDFEQEFREHEKEVDASFKADFFLGWSVIGNTLEQWINSSAVEFDNNQLKLEYAQYVALCNLLIEYVDLKVNIGTELEYVVFEYPFDNYCTVSSIPKVSTYFTYTSSRYGQIIIPAYFSDTDIYFTSTHVLLRGDQNLYSIVCATANSSVSGFTSNGGMSSGVNSYRDIDEYYTISMPMFSFRQSLDLEISYFFQNNQQASLGSCPVWYHYDGSLSDVNVTDIDLSGYHTGYICVEGYIQGFNNFVKSLNSYSATPDESQINDLADVLPLDKTSNPTLVIDSDPSIVNPYDAITVTDVPGVSDAALSEYVKKTNLDIDIPSVIIDKFPFCIPFDFIRILNVLCAEPVPPVFHIPISTNPDNLGDFAENQTIGQYLNGEHLFEIDEEIVIDLASIPLVRPVSYTIFIIGFVVLLIKITPNMINH